MGYQNNPKDYLFYWSVSFHALR